MSRKLATPLLSLGVQVERDKSTAPPVAHESVAHEPVAHEPVAPVQVHKQVEPVDKPLQRTSSVNSKQSMLHAAGGKLPRAKAAGTMDFRPDQSYSKAQVVSSAEFEQKSFALKRTRSMGVLEDLPDAAALKNSLVGTMADYPHLQRAGGVDNARDEHIENVSAHIEDAGEHIEDADSAHTPPHSPPHSPPTSAYSSSSHDSQTDPSVRTSITDSPPLIAADDSAVFRKPEVLVDYFSHNWNEADVSASWRYIVNRRHDVTNSARLENASWRSWAKAKNNLKTARPEKLNWLKDYDTTWLYGPLYHENELNLPQRSNSDDDLTAAAAPSSAAASASATCPAKPILKKRTMSQIMLDSSLATAAESNPTVGGGVDSSFGTSPSSGEYASNFIRHHKYRHGPHDQSVEDISSLVNKQYNESRRDPSPTAHSAPAAHHSPPSVVSLLSQGQHSHSSAAPKHRVVHFNNRVEQCISVDYESEPERQEADDEEDLDDDDDDEEDLDDDDDDDSEDEEESGGGLFLNVRSQTEVAINHPPGCRSIIASIPATTLKYGDDDDDDDANEKSAPTSRRSSLDNDSDSDSDNSDDGHLQITAGPRRTAVRPVALPVQIQNPSTETTQESAVRKAVAHALNPSSSRRQAHASNYDYSIVYVSPAASPTGSPLARTPIVSQTTAPTASAAAVHDMLNSPPSNSSSDEAISAAVKNRLMPSSPALHSPPATNKEVILGESLPSSGSATTSATSLLEANGKEKNRQSITDLAKHMLKWR